MPTKVHLVKALIFPVVMYGWETWTIKKHEHQRIMLLNCGIGEDSWQSLRQQGDQPSQSKEIGPEYSLEGLMMKFHTLVLRRADSIGKDSDARKDWGQEEKEVTEDEMVGWHHWLDGHEFEQTLGDREGQGNLGCYSPWGRTESDMTERLHFHFSLSCIGKGNGSPLHCSCLENPRDGRAWWAAIYGAAQSRTWLKRLSSSSNVAIHQSIYVIYPFSLLSTKSHKSLKVFSLLFSI